MMDLYRCLGRGSVPMNDPASRSNTGPAQLGFLKETLTLKLKKQLCQVDPPGPDSEKLSDPIVSVCKSQFFFFFFFVSCSCLVLKLAIDCDLDVD